MRQETDIEPYILIVEDSPVDYEITTRALRKAGVEHPVLHCRNGDEALDFLIGEDNRLTEKGSPSLIFLDLNLPGTDGRDVLERLKDHDDVKKIPVIVLTTSNNESDIEACYDSGANGYVQKPIAPDEYAKMAVAIKTFWFDYAQLPV